MNLKNELRSSIRGVGGVLWPPLPTLLKKGEGLGWEGGGGGGLNCLNDGALIELVGH